MKLEVERGIPGKAGVTATIGACKGDKKEEGRN